MIKRIRTIGLSLLVLLFTCAGVYAQSAGVPMEWWVNCNGYTGLLVLKHDAGNDRVEGTLLGTRVEGYLVDRHVVLHRFPQGRTQIWDGWILDPTLGASGESYYSGDFIVAGTCSESDGETDGVYPWFGIESGKTAGVPGTGDIPPPDMPLTGLAKEVTGVLQGLRWELPCANEASVCNAADPKPSQSTRLGGDAGQLYDVTLRFRGVVEYQSYTGGRQDGQWYVGGRSNNGAYNIYQLTVSEPPQTFFLNADRAGIARSWMLDYTRTVRMRGGAQVTLSADAQDGRLIGNHDDAGNPIIVPGIPPAPAPYDGQFIQMNVVSVRPVQGN